MATGNSTSPSLLAPAAGVAVGALIFWGLNFWFRTPIIPTIDDIVVREPMANVERPAAVEPGNEQPVGGPYQRVCQACHQADGKGMPGAFPPLAGSDWLVHDPETPIRIALLGLTGPIEVAGTQFNATMPPPPGMTDADIAEAITFARSNFGNSAPEVTEDMVKQVRASLAGRTNSWTSAELAGLRPAAGAEAALPDGGAATPAEGTDQGAEGAAEGAEAPGGAPAAPEAAPAPAEAAPAAPAPAEAAPAAPVPAQAAPVAPAPAATPEPSAPAQPAAADPSKEQAHE